MSNNPEPTTDPGQPAIYQIRLKGHLGSQWTDWFDGLTIALEEDGDTLLTGPVADQAALHGLLKKVRDLGIPLISVVPGETGPSAALGTLPPTAPATGQADVSIVRSQIGVSRLFTPKSLTTRRDKMNPTRKIAVITGVLFILATLAGPMLATPLTPDLTGADYLAGVSAQMNQAAGGVLLWIIAAFASAGIAVAMYPVLKERNVGLALGSVVFRALEAAFYMIGLVCLLSLLTLGQQFTTAGAADRAALQAIGALLVSVRDHAGLVAVFAFCVGAFMYYYLLFQSRLIPRWLSGFGIVAIMLMLTACVLALFSGNRITSYIPLAAPIAVQEMVLAVWLIVKGFSPSAIASEPARQLSLGGLR
jgi:hypothetical protein